MVTGSLPHPGRTTDGPNHPAHVDTFLGYPEPSLSDSVCDFTFTVSQATQASGRPSVDHTPGLHTQKVTNSVILCSSIPKSSIYRWVSHSLSPTG